jgi:hypothetical protein
VVEMRPAGSSSTAPNGAAPTLDRAPNHPFLQRLWRALRVQFDAEMRVTLQVAVMLADGVSRDEVGRRLAIGRAGVEAAASRIEQVAEQIVRDDDGPGP